ncbi:DNA cytosine methyltransferase [Stenotrophomonas sp. HITSZ_GD]|uniref:DNA cytosine methyltransferase n=1 Tax=Stenotrophomonas sp. HITSZ_GD TaxID=3037248 RepID=UPI00240D25CF|nr:DNA cytosine methyltransferase [Stenotrophomonas sp. HITSZ_GD]MDG2524600.1 DNA cytosine methyltransferase [Stenotrophomonas sp. HITSZ_GD]
MTTMLDLPTAVDLFSGVGGMSLGVSRAGFQLACSVELDAIASATHKINFPAARHLQHDVAELDAKTLWPSAVKLDLMVGGPPCQGFSTMGHGRPDDPRNDLFGHFFRIVAEAKPRAFLAENVPGLLAPKNAATIEAALSRLPSKYRVLRPTVVSAEELGAPTTRKRVFFFGYDPDEVDSVTELDLFGPEAVTAPTVGEALKGMPGVRSSWQLPSQGWRKICYDGMRADLVANLSSNIPPGVGSAYAIEQLAVGGLTSGNLGTEHTAEVVERFRRTPQGRTEPISRFPRLKESGYCPTLRAGTGSDRGSFQAVRPIHHRAHRVVSPREAARLQGFPDWFQFHDTKWHAFRQIGNSVSPVVAEVIVKRIRRLMV